MQIYLNPSWLDQCLDREVVGQWIQQGRPSVTCSDVDPDCLYPDPGS